MKNSIQLISTVLLGAIFTFISCKKDVDKFIPGNEPTWNLDSESPIFTLYDTLQNDPEVFEVILSQPSEFYTSKGTKISIKANGIYDNSGVPLEGWARIFVHDIFKKGDMVRYHRPTQTWAGELLRSDGVFQIAIIPDGQHNPVEVGADFGAVRIAYGDETTDPAMQLFWGEGDERFAWNLMGEAPVNIINWLDTLPSQSFRNDGYELFPYELDWINCDAFVDIPENEKTNVCVDLPNSFTNENAAVYMVFKSMNSVVELWGEYELKLFCQKNMPIGEEVKLIGLGITENNSLFMDYVDVVITENMTAELILRPASLDNINELLDSF